MVDDINMDMMGTSEEPSMCNVSAAAELYPKRGLLEDAMDTPTWPFQPVFGESIEYMANLNDNTVLALSNYRLFLQRDDCIYNTPLMSIEQAELRDLFHLHILCKDAQSFRVSFSTNEECIEWQRKVNKAMSAPRDIDNVFALAFFAWAQEDADEEAWSRLGGRNEGPISPFLVGSVEASDHTFRREVERLRFDTDGPWRVSTLNMDYSLCGSYPRLLLLPACISDEALEAVARFRSARRVPAVVWRHTGNGAVLARCSQPEVGWLGWRSAEDEELIGAMADACAYDCAATLEAHQENQELCDEPHRHPQAKNVLIVDARSYTTAVANRARGGGCECPEYYPRCDISFMNLANIHAVRKSQQALRTLLANESAEQSNWFSLLEGSRWFQLMSGLLRAAITVAAALEREARPVLVHCSDGWDRTPQIVALAQLLLDPYYRTIEGFQILVEREWLDFGHKFGDRCGLGGGASDDANERSPVFLQFLDCVYQLLNQFPCSFQFNQAYLVRLGQHVYSSLFGTFLCNCQQERAKMKVVQRTLSVWKFLAANPACVNLLYTPASQRVLWPSCSVRDLKVWSELYLGSSSSKEACVRQENSCPVSVSPSATPSPATPSEVGIGEAPPSISKTRSCEDLLSHRDNVQNILVRTSSHPSLTDSHHENVVSFNETESAFVEEVKDDENKEVVPKIPVAPPLPSIESSTDTLVPTTDTTLEPNPIITTIPKPKLCSAQILSQQIENNQHCHVCASSRKFLLESTPNNNASHYSTPNSYPPTPGSEGGLTTDEDSPKRNVLLLPNSSQQGKLEVDGLATLHSDVNTRLQHIYSDFQSQIDALQRELHFTRLALLKQVCHHCGPTDRNHTSDDTGSLPESVDSLAEPSLRPASDVSWEAIDEKETQPTLWVPDHAVRRCMGCDTEFWLGRRKHHCRNCGKIFCADCSWNTAPLPSEQLYEPVRVCAMCYHDISIPTCKQQVGNHKIPKSMTVSTAST